MWDWMCWINLGMFGLTYFIAKCGRLGCVRLDIIEGLVKTVDVLDKTISEGKAELIFQNVHCKERMMKFCVFWDGIYFSRLVYFAYTFTCNWKTSFKDI
jgi:hypothetical protein